MLWNWTIEWYKSNTTLLCQILTLTTANLEPPCNICNSHSTHPRFGKRAENWYFITIHLDCQSYIYDTVLSLRAQNIPYQGFVSSEWYWENIITFSFAASQIVSGQKCDECSSNKSKMGLAAGAYLKKWPLIKLSWSIHLLPDRPYIVPGSSPLVSSGASVLWFQITIGGIQKPAALTPHCGYLELVPWSNSHSDRTRRTSLVEILPLGENAGTQKSGPHSSLSGGSRYDMARYVTNKVIDEIYCQLVTRLHFMMVAVSSAGGPLVMNVMTAQRARLQWPLPAISVQVAYRGALPLDCFLAWW